ncbi:hypothetical protein QTL86_14875 [Cellulosilyticum sp. ST5]|uniref:hypothetical protein n=1 Tax=unclassified Cellulosilyticum TaxID=2643091 RepID=UPI000F8C82F0|nr:hypothetical protein [Cellulosilyticum sp. WCF-2]QEH67963.1 hypothetical protein EKH84_05990 [Cellulosilyticum sp. WCF-2]
MEMINVVNKLLVMPKKVKQEILKEKEQLVLTHILYDTEELLLTRSRDEMGTYLSCLNKKNEQVSVAIPLSAANLLGSYIAYDVLAKKEIGLIEDTLLLRIEGGEKRIIKLLPIS